MTKEERAARYEEWAANRRASAETILKHNEVYTLDNAFNTQPGHFPLRARVIAQNDRAIESLQIAEKFKEKAEKLRNPYVKGDRERHREENREEARGWVKVGSRVSSPLWGLGTVLKINKKTVTCQFDRGFNQKEGLNWISPA